MSKLLQVLIILTSLNSLAIDKAIYGDNDIVPIGHVNIAAIKNNAHASAMLVNTHDLNEVVDGKLFELFGLDFMRQARICKDEIPFINQKKYSKCSAVLIGEDKVLTAAHCIQNVQAACDRKSFIFDAKEELGSENSTQYFVKSQIYSCKKILSYKISRDNTFDYAYIQLDRKVEGGRKPVKLTNQTLAQGEPVYMVGHPNGFLSKYSGNAIIRYDDDLFYNTNLDAFGGNSGGPVFSSKDHSLIGLLIRGHDDFYWDSENKCRRVVKCANDECDGESVLKIGEILDDISNNSNN